MSRITPRDASAPKGRFRNLPQARTPTSCPSATTRDYHKCGGVNAENGILMMAFENLWRNYGRPRVLVVFELSFYFAGVWPPTKKRHTNQTAMNFKCDEIRAFGAHLLFALCIWLYFWLATLAWKVSVVLLPNECNGWTFPFRLSPLILMRWFLRIIRRINWRYQLYGL